MNILRNSLLIRLILGFVMLYTSAKKATAQNSFGITMTAGGGYKKMTFLDHKLIIPNTGAILSGELNWYTGKNSTSIELIHYEVLKSEKPTDISYSENTIFFNFSKVYRLKKLKMVPLFGIGFGNNKLIVKQSINNAPSPDSLLTNYQFLYNERNTFILPAFKLGFEITIDKSKNDRYPFGISVFDIYHVNNPKEYGYNNFRNKNMIGFTFNIHLMLSKSWPATI